MADDAALQTKTLVTLNNQLTTGQDGAPAGKGKGRIGARAEATIP